MFPLHDHAELKKLESLWYKSSKSFFFSKIPVGNNEKYFLNKPNSLNLIILKTKFETILARQ